MANSIIISNFNGARFLPKLLESLEQQRDVKTEIIVVDRNSSDGSHEILASHPNVAVIQEPPETGMVAGYAAGVRVAHYEHLFFCNEDMWFDLNCLRFLEARIDLGKRIAAADPWQWSYDGCQWIHGGVRFTKGLKLAGSLLPFCVSDFKVRLGSGDKIPLACCGAFLIHRKVFEELGGWDTSFFLDLEDIDLFIRAWQKGWFCVTTPEARVYHAVGSSNSQNLNNFKQSVNRRRYISSRVNALIIAVKYFSLLYIAVTFIIWVLIFFSHLLKLRFKPVVSDILISREFFQRLPGALKFRTENAQWNQQKPGQEFFKDSAFLGQEY